MSEMPETPEVPTPQLTKEAFQKRLRQIENELETIRKEMAIIGRRTAAVEKGKKASVKKKGERSFAELVQKEKELRDEQAKLFREAD